MIAVNTAVSPITLTISFSWIALGNSCAIEGWQVLGYAGTFVRQSGPILDVAGNWSGTATGTITPPGMSLGTTTLTYTATQRGSIVRFAVTEAGGVTYTCAGPIVGNVVSTACEGSFPPFASTCTATGSVTQTVNPSANPLTGTVAFTWTLGSDCGPASGATITGTGTDARQ